MTWECAECSRQETENGEVRISAVCHHCGKPLCQKDRTQVIDDAFSVDHSPAGRLAFHCRPCRRLHHASLAARMERNEE
jgi:hypothetical protein